MEVVMNKKIIFKIFMIIFISVLSINQLISSEDDKVPLLHSELRKRKISQIENGSENGHDLKKPLVQEQELESHDDIFSSVGKGWDFFKQGDYEKAYSYICLSSQAKNYAARYLVARFYEFGFAGKKVDSVIAAKFYSSVFANSSNPFLKSESEKGLVRMIALTKGKL